MKVAFRAAVVAISAWSNVAFGTPPRNSQPIELPIETPITCRDGRGIFQPMRDASFHDATLGTLEDAWADAGYAMAVRQASSTSAFFIFRNVAPPADAYAYTVRPHAGTIAILALDIEQRGQRQHLAGSDVCIQLFDILHH